MPKLNEMVRTVEVKTPEGAATIQILAESSSEFRANSYILVFAQNEEGGWEYQVYEAGDYLNFKELQIARGTKLPSLQEQILKGIPENPGQIQISGIGTSVILIGNFILKNGERMRRIIANTRKKAIAGKLILWVSVISGYVNTRQTPDFLSDPIVFTMHNEVHEEVLLWGEDGEAIRINFNPKWLDEDPETWPIFGHKFGEFKKSLNARAVPLDTIPWLTTMPIKVFSSREFMNNEFDVFFDTRFNNLQAVAAYEVDIDLREITLTSSETSFKGGNLYEEFFGGQGEESHLRLLSVENPYGDDVYAPDANSETGLVKVAPPEVLSEIFNVRREKLSWPTDTTKYLEIAITDGDWVRTEHAWKPFKI